MFKSIYKYLLNNTVLSVFILVITYCNFLYTNPDNFKFGLIVSIVYSVLFYIVTKDIYISVFFVFLVSAFFLTPAKLYRFEYAAPSEYVYETIPNGIFETISISISDLWGILLVLFFLRERVGVFIQTKKNTFLVLFNEPVVRYSLVAWFIYFSISLFSSLNYSTYPAFSVNVLAQYGKIVVVFIGTAYLFYKKRGLATLFYTVLLALLAFQSMLGILQFTTSLSLIGESEKLITLDSEQNNNFSRIVGISVHANNHAYAVALLVALTLPYVLEHRKIPWWIISFIGILNVIFSQSRTVWISIIAVFAYLYAVRILNIKYILNTILEKKLFFILIFLVCGSLLFIIPRLEATSIFFTEEGGGSLRFKMISQGWQLLQQAPLTGFGLGMGVRAFLDKFTNGYAYTFPFVIHFAYLQIALESGIPATFAFFLPFFFVVRKLNLISYKTQLHHLYKASIICSIIILFIYFTAQPMDCRREFTYLGIILGLGACLGRYN